MATSAFGGKGNSNWYRNRSVMTQIGVSAGKPKEISIWGNIVEFCMGAHLKSLSIVM